jgi:SARP family transcriptional regulator, regulator of embCAB operon
VSASAVLEVHVLDVVSVSAGSGPRMVIGSLQQKVLLSLLVANKGRSVGLDTIADELWPDLRPRRWRGCIATLANSLRAVAGDRDFISSTARGYTIHRRPELVRTDVEELHHCLDAARQAEADGVVDLAETMARRALAVYGGGPWVTDYWGWDEAAAEAARILAAALLARGAEIACIRELGQAMEAFDWHDGVWACLITAHHRLGSTRRALDLVQRAKLAVGGSSPILAKLEASLPV